MRLSIRLLRGLAVSLSLGTLAGSATAAPVFLNFDSVATGAPANDAASGVSLSFDFGAFLPELDEYGDPIPGSDAYRIDPDAVGPVRVENPAARGYGTAPSPSNALDALDQGVLIRFDSILDISLFTVTLDQSTFGFPGAFDIVFQDAAGNVLYSLATEQSVPGYIASHAALISNVASIYLPSGAYYDDLGFDAQPVPGPGALVLVAIGLAGLLRRQSPRLPSAQ